MIDKMIVDADLCIKLGSSEKYRFLYEFLPVIARQIYIHTHVQHEIMMPLSAVNQLKALISEGKVLPVNESNLDRADRAIYKAVYKKLEKVMTDPARPNKNKGEVCSLAYAKAAGIPVFATDEKELQPIIDKQLNTGMDNIICIRIVDIIKMAHDGEINLSRKICKALWIIAGKEKGIFDQKIWPFAAIERSGNQRG